MRKSSILNNKIIYTYGEHERFSAKYYQGKDFSLLVDVKTVFSYFSSHFDEFKMLYEYDGEKEDIDVY